MVKYSGAKIARPSFDEPLEGKSDLLDCEKQEGFVSPKSTFIKLPAGPLP